ncbi:hypothetical protein LCGC14_2555290, partial [marine sediment metagenome]
MLINMLSGNMLSEALLSDIIKAALQRGGEYADVFVERKRPLIIVLENGAVEKISTGVVAGVGIRLVFDEGKSAYAVSNDMSPDALLEAARSLARAASGSSGSEGSSGSSGSESSEGKAAPVYLDLRAANPGVRFDFSSTSEDVDIKRKLALIKEADQAARAVGPALRQVRVIYRDWTQKVQM